MELGNVIKIELRCPLESLARLIQIGSHVFVVCGSGFTRLINLGDI